MIGADIERRRGGRDPRETCPGGEGGADAIGGEAGLREFGLGS